MGYLTPILIRNDSLADIEKNKKQFSEQILKACRSHDDDDYSVGCSANAIEALATRHADVSRVIVVNGNSWVDLSDETYEFKRTDEIYLEYLEVCLHIAKREVNRLKNKIKELKTNSSSQKD